MPKIRFLTPNKQNKYNKSQEPTTSAYYNIDDNDDDDAQSNTLNSTGGGSRISLSSTSSKNKMKKLGGKLKKGFKKMTTNKKLTKSSSKPLPPMISVPSESFAIEQKEATTTTTEDESNETITTISSTANNITSNRPTSFRSTVSELSNPTSSRSSPSSPSSPSSVTPPVVVVSSSTDSNKQRPDDDDDKVVGDSSQGGGNIIAVDEESSRGGVNAEQQTSSPSPVTPPVVVVSSSTDSNERRRDGDDDKVVGDSSQGGGNIIAVDEESSRSVVDAEQQQQQIISTQSSAQDNKDKPPPLLRPSLKDTPSLSTDSNEQRRDDDDDDDDDEVVGDSSQGGGNSIIAVDEESSRSVVDAEQQQQQIISTQSSAQDNKDKPPPPPPPSPPLLRPSLKDSPRKDSSRSLSEKNFKKSPPSPPHSSSQPYHNNYDTFFTTNYHKFLTLHSQKKFHDATNIFHTIVSHSKTIRFNNNDDDDEAGVDKKKNLTIIARQFAHLCEKMGDIDLLNERYDSAQSRYELALSSLAHDGYKTNSAATATAPMTTNDGCLGDDKNLSCRRRGVVAIGRVMKKKGDAYARCKKWVLAIHSYENVLKECCYCSDDERSRNDGEMEKDDGVTIEDLNTTTTNDEEEDEEGFSLMDVKKALMGCYAAEMMKVESFSSSAAVSMSSSYSSLSSSSFNDVKTCETYFSSMETLYRSCQNSYKNDDDDDGDYFRLWFVKMSTVMINMYHREGDVDKAWNVYVSALEMMYPIGLNNEPAKAMTGDFSGAWHSLSCAIGDACYNDKIKTTTTSETEHDNDDDTLSDKKTTTILFNAMTTTATLLDHKKSLMAMIYLGRWYFRNGNDDRAAQLIENSCSSLPSIHYYDYYDDGDITVINGAHDDLVIIHLFQNDTHRAIDTLKRKVIFLSSRLDKRNKQQEEQQHDVVLTESYHRLGCLLAGIGNYREAVHYHSLALERQKQRRSAAGVDETTEEEEARATLLCRLGYYYVKLESYHEALRCYEDYRSIRQQQQQKQRRLLPSGKENDDDSGQQVTIVSPQHVDVGSIFSTLKSIYNKQPRPSSSHLPSSPSIISSLKSSLEVLYNMGLLYLRLLRYNDAETVYNICVSSLLITLTSHDSTNVVANDDDDNNNEKESLVLLSSSSSSLLQGLLTNASNNLGNVRYAQCRYDAAIEDYERALDWEQRRRRLLMNQKPNKHDNHETQSDEQQQQQQQRQKSLQMNKRSIGMLRNLGSAYNRVNDHEKAFNCYQNSLLLLTTEDHDEDDDERKNNGSKKNNNISKEILSSHHNLGLILCRKGELNEGLKILETCYDEAIRLKQQQQPPLLQDNNNNSYPAMDKLMLDLSSALIGTNQWERARDIFDTWRWEYHNNNGSKKKNDDDDDDERQDLNHPYVRQAKTISLRLLAYYDETTDII